MDATSKPVPTEREANDQRDECLEIREKPVHGDLEETEKSKGQRSVKDVGSGEVDCGVGVEEGSLSCGDPVELLFTSASVLP